VSTEDLLIDPGSCADEITRLILAHGIDPAATPAWPVWCAFVAYLSRPIDADHDAAACSSDQDPHSSGMHRLCLHRVFMRSDEHGRQSHWGVRCRLLCAAPPGWRATPWRITSFGCRSMEEFVATVEAHPQVRLLFSLPTWRLDVSAGSPPPDW